MTSFSLTSFSLKPFAIAVGAVSILAACSQGSVDAVSDTVSDTVSEKTVEAASSDTAAKPGKPRYMFMDDFSPRMAKFIGLKRGESFATAEPKIHAVFKAYDGHADPLDIRMESEIVEAGWKQILVTQDGLMDEAVTGQQLLAIFDADHNLVTYGIRIKCHSDNGPAEWQKTGCN